MSTINEVIERAMLANCVLRKWEGRKGDRDLNRELARSHGSDESRSRVTKKLCKCEELDRIITIQGQIRTTFYAFTSPWLDNGSRIIPAKLYMDLTEAEAPHFDAHAIAVQDFKKVYPFVKDRDKVALNGMYKERDYPPDNLIDSNFQAKIVFSPMPSVEDFRVNMAVDDLEEVKRSLQSGIEEGRNRLAHDLLRRLLAPIKSMAESLAVPDKIFRDSLVYNLVEVAEFLPKLNVTDDPEIAALIKEATEKLCVTMPDTLRDDAQVRELVADEAADLMEDIQNKMAGYL